MSNTRKLSENFLTTLKSGEIVINNTSQNNVKEDAVFLGASSSTKLATGKMDLFFTKLDDFE